ncbi:MAG: hypothetical protein Q9169_003364 [Polycauliona sp. 2 TL-2023]
MSRFIERRERLIDQALDTLQGERHITHARILETLEPMHRNGLAMARIEVRADIYRRNMRHFSDIAEARARAVPIHADDSARVFASLSALQDFVRGVQITTTREQRDVFPDVLREWRFLGWTEARLWEPLYELITGRDLVNE